MRGQDWLFVWATAFTTLAVVQGWWLWKEIQVSRRLHLHLLAAAQTFRDVANMLSVMPVSANSDTRTAPYDLPLRLLRHAVRFERAADEA